MENWENTSNPTGWGPPSNFFGKEFEGFPFEGIIKSERLGKFYDIFAAPQALPSTAQKRRTKDTAPAGPKEDDKGFVIVESKAATRAKKKSAQAYTKKPATTAVTSYVYFHIWLRMQKIGHLNKKHQDGKKHNKSKLDTYRIFYENRQ